MVNKDDFWVEALNTAHDRRSFSCGVFELDRYLKIIARQDVKKRVAAIYILTNDSKSVAGFYSLSQYSIDLQSLPDILTTALPKYPMVPVTLLGRFAIDKRFQGQGLAGLLLNHALDVSLSIAEKVGSAMVVVDAKDESAKQFYENFGFQSLREVPNRRAISMQTIKTLLEG